MEGQLKIISDKINRLLIEDNIVSLVVKSDPKLRIEDFRYKYMGEGKAILVISKYRKVIRGFFTGLTSLKNLKFADSEFRVNSMRYLFFGCTNLKRIYMETSSFPRVMYNREMLNGLELEELRLPKVGGDFFQENQFTSFSAKIIRIYNKESFLRLLYLKKGAEKIEILDLSNLDFPSILEEKDKYSHFPYFLKKLNENCEILIDQMGLEAYKQIAEIVS